MLIIEAVQWSVSSSSPLRHCLPLLSFLSQLHLYFFISFLPPSSLLSFPFINFPLSNWMKPRLLQFQSKFGRRLIRGNIMNWYRISNDPLCTISPQTTLHIFYIHRGRKLIGTVSSEFSMKLNSHSDFCWIVQSSEKQIGRSLLIVSLHAELNLLVRGLKVVYTKKR